MIDIISPQKGTFMYGSNYPLFDVVMSALYIVVFIFWIMLVFQIMMDVFRSHDLGGPAKAAWTLLILILPFLGALLYLISRGGSMHERQIHAVQVHQRAFEDYIRKVANTKE